MNTRSRDINTFSGNTSALKTASIHILKTAIWSTFETYLLLQSYFNEILMRENAIQIPI